MTRRLIMACVSLLASAVCLSADDLTVTVDPHADFTSIRTFAMREAKIESPRPELDNPLLAKRLSRAIREGLTARGLKEVADRPDLLVSYVLTSEDVSASQRSGIRGVGPRPDRFTEGTLVIDLTRPGDAVSIWRGVYRDSEDTGSKLVEKLSEGTTRLVARYPQLKK